MSLIPDSIIHLLQTGVSVIVGTRDASLKPECTRAWGIHVASDRSTVTIFLAEAIAGKTINNLHENGAIAVSCSRPTDHITCQLKGRVRMIRPVASTEQGLSQQWHRDFLAELTAIGVPRQLSESWIIEPTIAVDITVSEVFDQTPGPDAGRKIGE